MKKGVQLFLAAVIVTLVFVMTYWQEQRNNDPRLIKLNKEFKYSFEEEKKFAFRMLRRRIDILSRETKLSPMQTCRDLEQTRSFCKEILGE